MAAFEDAYSDPNAALTAKINAEDSQELEGTLFAAGDWPWLNSKGDLCGPIDFTVVYVTNPDASPLHTTFVLDENTGATDRNIGAKLKLAPTTGPTGQ
jgi:hypothetical protein